MVKEKKTPDLKGKRRTTKRRVKKNKFVTKSGKSVKINRTLSERSKARKDAKALRKSERLKGMPKGRLKRALFKLHPKRVFTYWFSRDGLLTALKLTGIAIVIGFFSLAALFAYFRKDLPNLRDITGSNIGGSVRYYDRTGEVLLWEDYEDIKRVPVELEDISPNLIEATIAIEDRDFYNHSGFNARGITRAALNNAQGKSTQGGSTITQQLVKLTTPGFSTEKTVTRKIKELILSVEIERSYTKDEIINGYLNSAPYGPIEWGAEIAAQTYFQKSAKDLSIDESAFLAAIPKSPSTYSPYGPAYDSEQLVGRMLFIIDAMHELGYITDEERDEAKATDTLDAVKDRPVSKYTGIIAPYFLQAAKDQLVLDLTETSYERGWKVVTTLDLELQKIAEEEVTNGLAQIRRQNGNTAAFVAEDVQTGQVVSLVGGADFDDPDKGKVNFAQEPLPPGSSFKPYDYLALIEKTDNAGAGSVLYDTQAKLEGWPCTNKQRPDNGGNCLWNYDFRYPGPLTLRYSLGGSRNIPAVKAMLIVGVDETIDIANRLGLYDDQRETGGYKCYEPGQPFKQEYETDCFASSAIGDGAYLNLDKHVHSYSTISRNGNKIPQTYILRVEDAEGKTISEWEPSAGEQVVRPDSAYIISDIMSDPRASYMSRKSHDYSGWDFSLKTGTTNDNKDGWLMGFSTKYSAGVWVGHDNNNPTCRGEEGMCGFMETMTQPIWNGWMQRAHNDLEPIPRDRPAGVQELPAYVVRNHVGVSSIEPSPTNDLFPEWYVKPTNDGSNQKITKDKVSGFRATECTPPLAIEETWTGNAEQFSSDPFAGGSSISNAEDNIHRCEDARPTISIQSFDNGNGNYTLEASVSAGTHPISSESFPGTLTISNGSSTIPGGSINVKTPGVYQFSYTAIDTGNKTFTATVTDSVLYQAESRISVFVKQAASNNNGNGNGNGNNNGNGDDGDGEVQGIVSPPAALPEEEDE